jgi:ferredoxin
MKTVDTFYANIYVGMREEYSDKIHNIEDAYKICQDYCDTVGLCVTVTPTKYIYKNGEEDGIIIGLINYPRFPSTPFDIETTAQKRKNELVRVKYKHDIL